MIRRLVAAAAAVAAAALAPTAYADPVPLPGGYCDGKVDVLCREHPCQPDLPCTIEFCAVWYGGRCLS